MNNSSIIERVKRLLALSTSSNPHEAANAAALADKLISRHQLTMAELQASNNVNVPVDQYPTPVYTTARRTAWKSHLVVNLAKHYDCAIFISVGRTPGNQNKVSNYTLVGRTEDCEIVMFMFNWLEQEITRLAKQNASGKGHAYSQTYCEGASVGIIEKLRAEKSSARDEATQAGKGAALILLDRKAIEAESKLRQLCPRLAHAAGLGGARNKDANAYHSGKEAGKSINVGKGLSGSSQANRLSA